MIKQENCYFDFTKITVGDVLYKEDVLVVEGSVIFPETLIKDLLKNDYDILFGCESFEEVVEKYPSEKLKEIKLDIFQRLKYEQVMKGRLVLLISDSSVYVMGVDGRLTWVNANSFRKTIIALAGTEMIL